MEVPSHSAQPADNQEPDLTYGASSPVRWYADVPPHHAERLLTMARGPWLGNELAEAVKRTHDALMPAVLFRSEMDGIARTLESLDTAKLAIQQVLSTDDYLSALSTITAGTRQFETLVQSLNYGVSRIYTLEQAVAREVQPQPPAQPGHFRRLPPEPEPPTIEVAQVAAPDWREMLSEVLTSGRASPDEVIELIRSALPLPSNWTEVQAVALAYKQKGHRYDSQDAFAMSMGVSRSTLQRMLRQYEQFTGERVLPGRGHSRRKLM